MRDAAGNQSSFQRTITRLVEGPGDTQPPTVVVQTPQAGLITNANVTVTGRVTDEQSGVASAQGRIDVGTPFDLTLPPCGCFSFSTNLPLDGTADGLHTVGVRGTDAAGNVSAFVEVSFTLDTVAPAAPAFDLAPQSDTAPVGDQQTTMAVVTLTGVTEPGVQVQLLETGAITTAGVGGQFSFAGVNLAVGANSFTVRATDAAGNPSTFQRTLTRLSGNDTQPPTITVQSPTFGQSTRGNVMVAGRVTDDQSGVAFLEAQVDAQPFFPVVLDAAGNFAFNTTLPLDGSADGVHTVRLRAGDQAGNVTAVQEVAFTLDTSDPAAGAVLDTTVATTLGTATQFLYTGSNPVQTGVAPGMIQMQRAAVVRGQVADRDGQPLAGVTITVLNRPEYGQTTSRADGLFDMAVNGGGLLTFDYALDGHFTAQRQVYVPWQDYAWLPDVVLVPMDSLVTQIDVGAGSPMQVGRGSTVTDDDGTRQATVLFPENTQAEMVLTDGTRQALTTLSFRATEYTVGPNGPAAMPGELPANSGYTYAVELSIDEAIAAGAVSVEFAQPVFFYVENFLNFPVGGIVPVGYYDRTRGLWVPSDNGQVIQIVGVSSGLAEVDGNGDGQPDSPAALAALGITEAERERLVVLYEVGQSLWRVPRMHFSAIDCNWPFGPPDGATAPNQSFPNDNQPEDKPKETCGCIIEVENQILGERDAVAGTTFTLNYRSDRTPGRLDTMTIPLSGASAPSNLSRIDLEILVAGQRITQSFTAAPNQSYTFTWNGLDAYGRALQGGQSVTIRIGYAYGAVYRGPSTFGRAFAQWSSTGTALIGSRSRQEVVLWQTQTGVIGNWEAREQGLGGWTLDVHHTYDPAGQVLYFGDGSRRSVTATSNTVIRTVVGGGTTPVANGLRADQVYLNDVSPLAVGPDGSLYFSTYGGYRVWRVDSSGILSVFAGTGVSGHSGDGGPATEARLRGITGIAVAPDGSFYLAMVEGWIRRVTPDGVITTVGGTGVQSYSGDGGPALQAAMRPQSIAVGPDGGIYFSEVSARIRRIGTDGIITTVVGNGLSGFTGDGGPATSARIQPVGHNGLAFGPDGSLYLKQRSANRVRRVSPGGIITTVAGTSEINNRGPLGDGGPALQANISSPDAIAVGPDGSLYIAHNYFNAHHRLRRVSPDGIITTIAGNGTSGFSGDGGPATQAQFNAPLGIAIHPDGSLYVTDYTNRRIRQVYSALLGYSASDLSIASEDGNLLYRFNASGRHLETRNALTGAVVYSFRYNAAGKLIAVEDGYGNTTTLEHDAAGNPTALVAPFGQRTTFTVDANGYLASVTNPAGNAIRFEYTAGGLLTTRIEPAGGIRRYGYDALGRLISDDNPDTGITTFTRTTTANGYTVTRTTAQGHVTTYRVERLATGGQRWVTTSFNNLQTVTTFSTDGTRTVTYPDGTRVTVVEGPDPRWGMQAPIASSVTLVTPGGVTSTLTTSRTVTLAVPNNPLSLQTLTDTTVYNGRTYTTTYNAALRRITETSPDGRQYITLLDIQGRVVSEQLVGLLPTTYAYDTRGRLVSATQGTGADARTTTVSYDTQGNIATLVDAEMRTWRFEQYDLAGRPIEVTLPDDRTLYFAYDANGNVRMITPPGQPEHTFTHTPADRVQSYTAPPLDASSSTTSYEYTVDGQLDLVRRPGGVTIDLAYDLFGRLSTIAIPEGQVSLDYHPTTGQLRTLTATDGGTLTFGYDGFLPNRVTWAGEVAGTVGWTYNSDLRVASQSVNGGSTVNFGYNSAGLLTQAGALALTRDPVTGFVRNTTLGSVTTTAAHTTLGELASYTASVNGAALLTLDYSERDDLGRITRKVETIDGVTDSYEYRYYDAGFLREVLRNGTVIASYVYDDNGNRLSRTDANGNVNGVYDAQDRLTQYGSTSYTYTAHGELQSKTVDGQTTQYEYDALGNLRSVTLPDGTQIEYVIDGNNRRIGKRVNGTLVQGLLYQDQLNPVAELDGNGNVVSRFVYGVSENIPEYLVRDGLTYRILTDHLGSVRLVVDTATGAVAQRLDYDEFGNVLLDTNPGFQPFGFAGGLYDRDTGLVRFGVRDFDPVTGRWTAKDPIRFAGQDSNLYGYAGNDPVNVIDPTGLEGEMSFPLEGEMSFPPEFPDARSPQTGPRNRKAPRGPGCYLSTSPPRSLWERLGAFIDALPIRILRQFPDAHRKVAESFEVRDGNVCACIRG